MPGQKKTISSFSQNLRSLSRNNAQIVKITANSSRLLRSVREMAKEETCAMYQDQIEALKADADYWLQLYRQSFNENQRLKEKLAAVEVLLLGGIGRAAALKNVGSMSSPVFTSSPKRQVGNFDFTPPRTILAPQPATDEQMIDDLEQAFVTDETCDSVDL